nr:MAG TPA: hypothetical protein [Caudoviricetes sp.]
MNNLSFFHTLIIIPKTKKQKEKYFFKNQSFSF